MPTPGDGFPRRSGLSPVPPPRPRDLGGIGEALGRTYEGALGVFRGLIPQGPEDVYVRERFDLLGADIGCVVAADDGVPLQVRECGPADAELTVLFAHGYCLRMEGWHFQRAQLDRMWGGRIRMVFYDQRGHGGSGEPTPESCTIGQLGDDMAAVIRSAIPTGRILVVGHSMGGMTALAFARRHPAMLRERVVGMALVATASDGLSDAGISRGLDVPIISALADGIGRLPRVADQGRRLLGGLISPVLRWSSFSERSTSRKVSEFSERMLNETSVTTVSRFFAALKAHDEAAALPEIAHLPVSIVVGTKDVVTPLSKSKAMHRVLPESELVVIENAGHMVMLEQPEQVSRAIGRLIGRILGAEAADTAAGGEA